MLGTPMVLPRTFRSSFCFSIVRVQNQATFWTISNWNRGTLDVWALTFAPVYVCQSWKSAPHFGWIFVNSLSLLRGPNSSISMVSCPGSSRSNFFLLILHHWFICLFVFDCCFTPNSRMFPLCNGGRPEANYTWTSSHSFTGLGERLRAGIDLCLIDGHDQNMQRYFFV